MLFIRLDCFSVTWRVVKIWKKIRSRASANGLNRLVYITSQSKRTPVMFTSRAVMSSSMFLSAQKKTVPT